MIIITKYESSCKECGITIPAGIQAKWYRNGAIYCLNGHNGNERPLVNSHATAIERDKQLSAQQRFDKQKAHKSNSYEAIYNEAHNVGLEAIEACKPTPMVVQQHENMLDDLSPVKKQWYVSGGICGFAWVNIKPATSSFCKWLKANGKGKHDSYYGGLTIWVSYGNQSYELKMAYARAFASVLQEHGFDAYASGRLD